MYTYTIHTLLKTEILIVHNSLNYSNLPIIKHYLTKIIYRNSCYFGFYPHLCNVIRKRTINNLKHYDYESNSCFS